MPLTKRMHKIEETPKFPGHFGGSQYVAFFVFSSLAPLSSTARHNGSKNKSLEITGTAGMTVSVASQDVSGSELEELIIVAGHGEIDFSLVADG